MISFDFLALNESISRLSDALREAICILAEDIIREFSRLTTIIREQVNMRGATALMYATPKERHYILHGRKSRTQKKYINRVLRRVNRNKRRYGG